EVFAGPEDRLDALAQGSELRSLSGFVFAARAHDRGVQFADGSGEVAACAAFVAQQRFAAATAATGEHLEADVALVALWRCERERSGRAVRGEDRVQPKPPEVARMAGGA